MKNTTKLIVSGAIALQFWAQSAQATIVAMDTFDYPDGILVGAPGSIWAYREGTRNQLDVASGRVILTAAESEDATISLLGGPYTTGFLTATFEMTVLESPSSTGAPIAGFENIFSTTGNGRIMVTSSGASEGMFRLGVSNNGLTGSGGTYVPMELSIGVTYFISLTVDLAKDISSFSVNGGAAVSATDSPNNLAVNVFRLRQVSYMGGSTALDDLQVTHSTVPEPGTLLLLAPGFLWLSTVRHRRRGGA